MVKKHNIVSRALVKLKLMQKQLSEESQVLDELKEKEDADQCEIEALQAELEAKTVEVLSLGEELKKRASEKEKAEAALRNTSAEVKTLLEKCETLKGDHDGALLKLDEMSSFNQRLLRSLKEKEEIYKNEVAAAKAETADEAMLVATLRDELKKQKDENVNLSHKFMDRSAELKAALDKERAEFGLNLEKAEKGAEETEKRLGGEIETLKENLRQKAAEAARSDAEIKAIQNQHEALKQNDEGRLLHALKEKEEVYKSEVEAARSDAAGKEALAASLKEELNKQREENARLARELLGRATESKVALEKERAEFRLNLDKLEKGSEEAEKRLLSEVETLKESLRQKAAEAARSDAEIKALQNQHEALKQNDEGRLLHALKEKEEVYKSEVEAARSDAAGKEALAASLKEELNKQREENARLARELLGRATESKVALEKERAEFRLNLDKLEKGSEEAEKRLLSEVETLKESLRQKAAEAARSDAEIKAIQNQHEALKQNDEGRLLHALKEKEEVYKSEVEAARADTAGKEALAASLREELKKQKEENLNLSHELLGTAAEYKAALEKERAEFRLTLEKMETGVAEGEKGLLGEVEALRDSLRQKAAELAHSGAQIQTLLNKHDAVKTDYEARLLKLDGLNASVKEEVNKHKTEMELLSLELRSKAAEFKARLDSEKAEAKNEHKKAQEEIRELNETIKRLQRETEQAGLEAAKVRDENAAIKAQRDTGFVKLTEQEIYAKSASSALKENREELEVVKDRMKDLTEEMDKAKADSRRRLELLRLELEEKNRQLSHLNRELEKGKAEKESLRSELAAREKAFNEKLEKQRKEFRSGQEKNHGNKP